MCDFVDIIRHVQSQDLAGLAEIERLCISFLSTPTVFEQVLDREYEFILGLFQQERVLGYIHFQQIDDEIQLFSIAVHPQYRRHHIGEKLFQAMINQDKTCQKVFLEVRYSNEAARSFYLKLGFRELSLRKNYYPDGEDGLVMIWEPL